MERKLNEFLVLTQGTRTVLQYAQAFNHLCQYAGYHADNDAKKQDRFRRGLNTKLKKMFEPYKGRYIQRASQHGTDSGGLYYGTPCRKRSKGSPLDPRAFNPRNISLFRMHCLEYPNGMIRLVDWFSSRLNHKKSINLLYLCNNHNNLAHGQMFNKSNREAAPITVSIAEVRIISSEIVRSPRNLIKGRVPVRMTRTRARGR
jgi:hypothetical protein